MFSDSYIPPLFLDLGVMSDDDDKDGLCRLFYVLFLTLFMSSLRINQIQLMIHYYLNVLRHCYTVL
jgi:hypothetical protein